MRSETKPFVTSEEITRRKQRWIDFMKPDAAPGFMFAVHYDDPGFKPPAVHEWPDKKNERIENKWAWYRHELEQAAWIDDDFIPRFNMMTGTEIFAEAFGCPVHRPEDNNPFALPLIHSAGEVAGIKVPDLESSPLAYLFDMADELRRRAGPDCVFHLVDVQSPMDIAALIWEKSSFYMGLLDAPEAVKELAYKTRGLLTAFFDEWFKRYGSEYIAHCPDYFMSGGLTLSEDEVGAVDEQTFLEFFLPELSALSRHFGGLGIHCCADARHQWEHFKKVPDLRLMNLCAPPTRNAEQYVTDAYRDFAGHCAQWHGGWYPEGSIETWPGKLPPGIRVVLETTANSREHAIELCCKMKALRNGA